MMVKSIYTKLIKTGFFALLALWLFVSCKKEIIYEEFKEIDPSGWSYISPVSFKFDIKDTSQNYDVLIFIRNESRYSYSNLWINYTFLSPTHQISKPERMEFTLASANGRWLGTGLGDLIDHKFIMLENIRFHEKGIFTIQLKHEMRDDKLKGIRNVGFSIRKHHPAPKI